MHVLPCVRVPCSPYLISSYVLGAAGFCYALLKAWLFVYPAATWLASAGMMLTFAVFSWVHILAARCAALMIFIVCSLSAHKDRTRSLSAHCCCCALRPCICMPHTLLALLEQAFVCCDLCCPGHALLVASCCSAGPAACAAATAAAARHTVTWARRRGQLGLAPFSGLGMGGGMR